MKFCMILFVTKTRDSGIPTLLSVSKRESKTKLEDIRYVDVLSVVGVEIVQLHTIDHPYIARLRELKLSQ